MNDLEILLGYCDKGWRIFPLKGYEKTPIFSDWQKLATSDKKQIETWARQYPFCNWGLATGELVVIDIDTKKGATVDDIPLPPTLVSKTGNNGYHYFYRANGYEIRNSVDKLASGIDVRGIGGFVVIPPSKYNNGYHWQNSNEIANFPSDLYERLKPAVKPPYQVPDKIENHSRNDSLTRMAGSLWAKGFSEESLLATLRIENQERCNPPLDDKEIEQIARSITRYEQGELERSKVNLTDTGNATRLADSYHQVLRYTEELGWLYFDGTQWLPDKNRVMQLARKIPAQIGKEAWDIEDKQDRQAMLNWAIRSEMNERLNAMVSLTKTDERILTRYSAFDSHPMYLNVANGTIDLPTGELLPHNSEHLLTRKSNVAYDASATCPNWLAFLDKVFQGNTDLIKFVQLAIGYSLTQKTGEKCLFFLSGPKGDNGKTTFTNALEGLLGNYYQSMRASTLLKKKFENEINNDIARTKGARVIVVPEMPKGQSFNEERIKSLTGNDLITARFLHKEHFDFRLEAKIWLVGNDKPSVPDDDSAFWSRMKVIPFDYQFKPEEIERDFYRNRLEPELPGILNWAIEGCLEWQKTGLVYPEAVRQATAAYREENDSFSNFIHDKCQLDPNSSIQLQELFTAYQNYCREEGYHTLSNKKFGAKLEQIDGIEKRRAKQGMRLFGITLTETDNTF